MNVFEKYGLPDPSKPAESQSVFAKYGLPEPVAEPSGLARRALGDTGISLAKGVIGLPEAAVGLANLPTGGLAGKAAQAIGFAPKEWKGALDEYYSPEQKAANAVVQQAEGFGGKLKAAIQNPSVIAGTVAESLPLMLGGGAIARALPAGMSAVARGALGEGIVGAGSASEQMRQSSEDGLQSPKQAIASLASGAGTAAFGALGGKVAQKFGIADPDTMLAGGTRQILTDASGNEIRKGLPRRIAEAGLAEGVLEELPQSMWEQAAQNYGTGKPLAEGVPEAAAMGMLAGGVMGAAGGAISRPSGPISKASETAAASGATFKAEFDRVMQEEQALAAEQTKTTKQGPKNEQAQEASTQGAEGVSRGEDGATQASSQVAGPYAPVNEEAQQAGAAQPAGGGLSRSQIVQPGAATPAVDDEFAQFAMDEAKSLDAQRHEIAGQQAIARRAKLEAVDGRVEAQRKQQAEANRLAVMDSIDLPAMSNPVAAFEAGLSRAGIRQSKATQAEVEQIGRRVSAVAGLSQPEPDIPSLPNELELPEKQKSAVAPSGRRMQVLIRRVQSGARIKAGKLLNKNGKTTANLTADEEKALQPYAKQSIQKQAQTTVNQSAAPKQSIQSLVNSFTTPAQPTTGGILPQQSTALDVPKVANASPITLQHAPDSFTTSPTEKPATVRARKIAVLKEKLRTLEPFDDGHSEVSDALTKEVSRDTESAISAGDIPVYRVNDSGLFIAVHPSAQQDGMIQVTRYDKSGVLGDSQYKSAEEAVRFESLIYKDRLPQKDAEAAIVEAIAAESKRQEISKKPVVKDSLPPSPAAKMGNGETPDSIVKSPDSTEITPISAKSNEKEQKVSAAATSKEQLPPIGFRRLLAMKSKKLLQDGKRKLYEVKISAEFRKKHFVHGRMPIEDGLELRMKEDVTGSPYDDGWVLIDSREQLAERRASQQVAEQSAATTAKEGQTPEPKVAPTVKQSLSVAPTTSEGSRKTAVEVPQNSAIAEEPAQQEAPKTAKPTVAERRAAAEVQRQAKAADEARKIADSAPKVASLADRLHKAIASTTGERKAALEAKLKRLEAAKPVEQRKTGTSTVKSRQSVIQGRDDLVGAIMRATGGNGIAASMAQTIAGDTSNNLPKLKGLFTNRGQEDLGDVAMLLRKQEGYDVRDGDHLSELIRNAAAGDVAVSMERQARDSDAAKEQQHRDRIRDIAKRRGIKTAFVKFADLEKLVFAMMESRRQKAVDALDERSRKRFEAALEESYRVMPEDDVEDVLVSFSKHGLTGRDYWNQVTDRLRIMNSEAIYAKEQEELYGITEGQEPAWLKDGDGRGDSETGSGNQTEQGAAKGFSLEQQTLSDIDRQEAERVAAEKAKQDAADQEAKDKKAAEKQSLEDSVKARAANPDNFQFGEDSKAAAKPMGGLFDQPAQNDQKPVQPAKAEKAAQEKTGDEWLDELFGTPEQQEENKKQYQAEEDARNAITKANAERVRAAISEQIERATKERAEWDAKVYKRNRTQVEFRGDGPARHESMSIGAINEGRRRKAIDALTKELAELKKLYDAVSTDTGATKVFENLKNIMERARVAADSGNWPMFPTKESMFEYILLDDMKFRGPGGKGGTSSNGLSKAMLSVVQAEKPAQPAKPDDIESAPSVTENELKSFVANGKIPHSITLYHGSAAKSLTGFNTPIVFLAANKEDAGMFATHPVLNHGATGDQKVYSVTIPAGKIEDISGIVDDSLDGDRHVNEVINEAIKDRLPYGYKYVAFNHPGFGDEYFLAVVSGDPKSLKIVGSESAKPEPAAKPEADDARFNVAANLKISPADSAVYEMARDGKSAAEILEFLGKASRNGFNRYLANALRNMGVSSTVKLDSMGGWAFNRSKQGPKYAAAYSPKTDTIALFTPREAERHILHEFVHGVTLKAIMAGGRPALEMKRLFEHVKASGALDGMYGMTNLDEFVAEAFSNPEFQRALMKVAAPRAYTVKTAWDAFVRFVAKLVGLNSPALQSALDKAMVLGAELMRENAKLSGNGGDTRFSRARKIGDTTIIENPTRQQARVMLAKSDYKELRGLQIPETGKLFIWDASKLLHEQAATELGFSSDEFQQLMRKTDGHGKGLLNIKDLGEGAYPYPIFSGERKDDLRFSQESDTINVDGTDRPRTNSNGKPIADTDEGLRNFWRWFGESRATDEQGRPRVFYHGTDRHLDVIEPGYKEPGAWFTSRLETAAPYGKGDDAEVYSVYLRAEKPFVADFSEWIGSGEVTIGEKVFDSNVDIVKHAQSSNYDSVDFAVGNFSEDDTTWVVFDSGQIKSADQNNGAFSPENPDIRFNVESSDQWVSSSADNNTLDDIIYKIANKQIDLRRTVQDITKKIGEIADEYNPELAETLYHGKAANETKNFLDFELRPLIRRMLALGVDTETLETYLWARHAEERNEQIAKINPRLPDGGSGLTNEQARQLLSGQDVTIDGKTIKGVPQDKLIEIGELASMSDAILKKSRELLVSSGLESQSEVDSWSAMYQHYAPLHREEFADDRITGKGLGMSVKGPSGKRAIGSDKPVSNILASIVSQRELYITRAEKNKVGNATYGLATIAPNEDFWKAIDPMANASRDAQQLWAKIRKQSEILASKPDGDEAMEAIIDAMKAQHKALMKKAIPGMKKVKESLEALGLPAEMADRILAEPKELTINKRTGMVVERVNPLLRHLDNVLATRINGRDVFVVFNARDKRASRMAMAMKNLDADNLGFLLGNMAKATRYFSAINTQFNPIFGVTNLARDIQTAMLNLSSTPLAGHKAEIAKRTFSALHGIYRDLRDHRAGKAPSSKWAATFEQFKANGGATGYRDMFESLNDRAKDLQDELKKMGMGKARRMATLGQSNPVFAWLSDYNEMMENSTRVAAFSVAIEQGMSHAQAAALAKELTVNFNRKGQVAAQAGAMYAFFNAAVQGTARIAQTLVTRENGKTRLTYAGRKIIAGGIMLGVVQAILGALAGWDDEEPPQFVRERSLIIPIGDHYVSIPMPLGYNVLPNIGRITTEFALSGFKDPAKRISSMINVLFDTFNPIGNAGMSLQTITPTVIDPLAALSENKDWTGKPIKRMTFNEAGAGYKNAKDTATAWSKMIAEGLNYLTGGTEHKAGLMSPTPDQIDYLIGQVTGGVGRELSKVVQTGSSIISGEDLPLYKIPLAGKFVGSTTGQAAESSRFYANLDELKAHKAEIDGRRKAHQDVAGYLQDNPDARLVPMATRIEHSVQELRRAKRVLLAKSAPPEQVKAIDARITAYMKVLNVRVDALQRESR